MTEIDPAAMRGELVGAEALIRYIYAGNSRFTVVSRKSGIRFTYRVKRKPDATFWFVSLLAGPDNDDDSNYSYMGYIFGGALDGDGVLRHGAGKAKVGVEAPSWALFSWFFRTLQDSPNKLSQAEFWHEGRCGRCARVLTVPESVAQGFGPECIHYV